MAGSYEAEQARLQRLLLEVETDENAPEIEDSDSDEFDHCEELEHDK
jgi:hypothetical protein